MNSMSVGLLVLRLVAGLGLAAHGAQKAFGWFDGPNVAGVRGMVQKFGYRPIGLWAAAICIGEVGGGLLLAFGLLTPVAVALIVADLLQAILQVHLPKGFFAAKGGFELALMFMASAVAVVITGPGSISIDNAVGLYWMQPLTAVLAIVAGVVGGLLPYATRTTHEVSGAPVQRPTQLPQSVSRSEDDAVVNQPMKTPHSQAGL